MLKRVESGSITLKECKVPAHSPNLAWEFLKGNSSSRGIKHRGSGTCYVLATVSPAAFFQQATTYDAAAADVHRHLSTAKGLVQADVPHWTGSSHRVLYTNGSGKLFLRSFEQVEVKEKGR